MLAMGACGAEHDQGIEAALNDLRRGYLTEDYRRVCNRLSAGAQREVGEIGHETPSTCPQDVENNVSAAIVSPRDRVDPEIQDITMDGDRAIVTAILGGTTPSKVYLIKRHGKWQLERLFGTSGPPAHDLR
jgi:hypothetical protein